MDALDCAELSGMAQKQCNNFQNFHLHLKSYDHRSCHFWSGEFFEPNPCFVFLRLSAFESVGLTHQQPDAYWVRPGIFGGPKSSQESPIPTRVGQFQIGL